MTKLRENVLFSFKNVSHFLVFIKIFLATKNIVSLE